MAHFCTLQRIDLARAPHAVPALMEVASLETKRGRDIKMGPVSMEVRDGVALIAMSNPPVNALAIPGIRARRIS